MRPCRVPASRRGSTLLFAVLALGCAAAADAAAQAQATTGVIRGVVRDPVGAPVAGAAVVIEHRATGFTTTVVTGSNVTGSNGGLRADAPSTGDLRRHRPGAGPVRRRAD